MCRILSGYRSWSSEALKSLEAKFPEVVKEERDIERATNGSKSEQNNKKRGSLHPGRTSRGKECDVCMGDLGKTTLPYIDFASHAQRLVEVYTLLWQL